MERNSKTNTKPHVVIIGGGFGGLEAAKRLRKAPVRVTLIDRNNYHLFQPLLYQVGTGGLSPANIATPLRAILGRQRNCQFVLGEVIDIDLERQQVSLHDGEIDFDLLIVAAGSTNNFFGNTEWERHATGLKSLEDAVRMRRQVFSAYEAAERESDADVQKALMTFVVVGGGPTGVELAGALSEIARHTLKHDFRHINPSQSRIILVEAGENILAQYPEDLCASAERDLEKLGVEVRTRTSVTHLIDGQVSIKSEHGPETIASRTVLWAAGVAASPLARMLAEGSHTEVDRVGRIPVTSKLTLEAFDNVFVIGDMAAASDANGETLPGVAPVAIQQGKYAATAIKREVRGEILDAEFKYQDLGSMATIGRASAIAKIGCFKFRGLLAWVLWLAIHLVQIMQFPNRLLILIQWTWNYLTFNRSARIITATDKPTNPAYPKTKNDPQQRRKLDLVGASE